jgi:hypothetical protein
MKTTLIFSLTTLIISVVLYSGAPAEQRYGDGTDVIALVRFLILSQDSPEENRKFLDKRIEFFKRVPGLKRKYYTDGNTPGLSVGVYHWDSRAQAMNYYDAAWHADMKQRTESYSLEILDIEVVQDVETGEVTRF